MYALETSTLGKRYGKYWALRHCTLQLPQGGVIGLVGLNGAGKTTLMYLLLGLLRPTEGTIHVLGKPLLHNASLVRPAIGFVSQERSLYQHFTVAETLTMGKKLNPHWNDFYAHTLIERLQLPRKQRVSKLSGGQQARLTLIMALAKKPELLLLDEPLAHVDLLAKHELSKILMEAMIEQPMTLVISSHNISDLDTICDHLVILDSSHVRISEQIEHIKEHHKLLIGPREHFESIASAHTVIRASHTGRQSTILVRTTHLVLDPAWQAQDVSLEDIVLAYLAPENISGVQQQSDKLIKEII